MSHLWREIEDLRYQLRKANERIEEFAKYGELLDYDDSDSWSRSAKDLTMGALLDSIEERDLIDAKLQLLLKIALE